jgi:hypothetical protein
MVERIPYGFEIEAIYEDPGVCHEYSRTICGSTKGVERLQVFSIDQEIHGRNPSLHGTDGEREDGHVDARDSYQQGTKTQVYYHQTFQ